MRGGAGAMAMAMAVTMVMTMTMTVADDAAHTLATPSVSPPRRRRGAKFAAHGQHKQSPRPRPRLRQPRAARQP